LQANYFCAFVRRFVRARDGLFHVLFGFRRAGHLHQPDVDDVGSRFFSDDMQRIIAEQKAAMRHELETQGGSVASRAAFGKVESLM
jgi:hypothetical protein